MQGWWTTEMEFGASALEIAHEHLRVALSGIGVKTLPPRLKIPRPTRTDEPEPERPATFDDWGRFLNGP